MADVEEKADYKPGDRVEYEAVGGGEGRTLSFTTGLIMDVLTEPETDPNTGRTLHASPEEPRYKIRNDRTAKVTAYKRHNIVGKVGEVSPEELEFIKRAEATKYTGEESLNVGHAPPTWHRTLKFKPGDRVEYHPIGANKETLPVTTGVVVEVDVLPTEDPSTGRTLHASEWNPVYKIRNDHTGRVTGYYERNIVRKIGEIGHPEMSRLVAGAPSERASPEPAEMGGRTKAAKGEEVGAGEGGTQGRVYNVKYKVGDKVEYEAVGGGGRRAQHATTTGVIVEVDLHDTDAGTTGRTVHASPTEPRYKIRNDKTGKVTAYKEENIINKIGEVSRADLHSMLSGEMPSATERMRSETPPVMGVAAH